MALDYSLPLLFNPRYNQSETLALLLKTKNQLIGHSARKRIILNQPESLLSLVQLLSSDKENSEHCIQAASILSSLSSPTRESVEALLACNAHVILISTLTSIYRPFFIDLTAINQDTIKLSDTLLRAVRKLYSDLVTTFGPKEYGGAELLNFGKVDSSGLKGKGKGKGKEKESRVEVRYREALQALYGTDYETTISVDQPEFVKYLFKALSICSDPDAFPWSAARFKRVEMICCLFFETARTRKEREILLGDDLNSSRLVDLLSGFILKENGKVCESALRLLAALSRNNPECGLKIPWETLLEIPLHSQSDDLRTASASCGVAIFKSMSGSGSDDKARRNELLTSTLIELLSKEARIQSEAAFLIATHISQYPSSADIIITLHILPVLYTILSRPSTIQDPEPTLQRSREAALLILAILASNSESHRAMLINSPSTSSNLISHPSPPLNFLPLIIVSLSHPDARIQLVACHALRMLSRSVNILRTSLVDTDVAARLIELLGGKGDDNDTLNREEVRIGAVAVVINLLVEFSPLRAILIKGGCIEKLCTLAKAESTELKVSALWALKNASYESTSNFKRSVVANLTWPYLGSLVDDTNSEVAEKALGILRNVFCTFDDDPVIVVEDDKFGQERLLSLLESKLLHGEDPVIETTLYVLVNLATVNQATRQAIVARSTLLPIMLIDLESSNNKIRCATIWVLINLCQQDKSSRAKRSPSDIGITLKRLGVGAKLANMIEDPCLNVRERVRDCILAVELITRF